MRLELEQLRLVEHQVLGNPSAADAAAWRARLLADPELQADVEAQQQLYRGLQAVGRQQLRQELATIHAKLYPPRRRNWVRATVAGLCRTIRWSR